MSSGPKVICLGLGRTGTTSLRTALEILGLGPCYHMSTVLQKGNPKDFELWTQIGTGIIILRPGQFEGSDSEIIDKLLGEYRSVLDYPAVLYHEAIYQAYPDAKYILTTRDPSKWEASMNQTILRCVDALEENKHRPPILEAMLSWFKDELLGRYHKDINIDAQGEFNRHNERMRSMIPHDKLLIYEVTQGWTPLVKFLGLETPNEPFPNANDSLVFNDVILPALRTFGSEFDKEAEGMSETNRSITLP
ncbi:hypothetical protein Clacol_000217 [Clathrus columnatus]|uniref:P-loop containing nucleoside triphosphate hydrolase protein n=1 Tax=Clathrus columnatus TaxID=1419009 RepID=A0AAV4ZWS8_9AGAM|nr:hypothetical protein Clacol_000217 [Clathrus columnatus]